MYVETLEVVKTDLDVEPEKLLEEPCEESIQVSTWKVEMASKSRTTSICVHGEFSRQLAR